MTIINSADCGRALRMHRTLPALAATRHLFSAPPNRYAPPMHRSGLVLLLVACGPPAPNPAAPAPVATATAPAPPTPAPPTPGDLAAICVAELHAGIRPGEPPNARFTRALEAAEGLAVSDAARQLLRRMSDEDLAERAADLRRTAAAAGVTDCALAQHMEVAATATPNVGDARNLLDVLDAMTVVAPEQVDRILAAGCSEIPACAGACAPGLADFGVVEPGPRAAVLTRGCAEFRALAAGDPDPGAAMLRWVRARVAAFADRCAPLLAGEDAARLAELRKNLSL
jgi:hypothetical protein